MASVPDNSNGGELVCALNQLLVVSGLLRTLLNQQRLCMGHSSNAQREGEDIEESGVESIASIES